GRAGHVAALARQAAKLPQDFGAVAGGAGERPDLLPARLGARQVAARAGGFGQSLQGLDPEPPRAGGLERPPRLGRIALRVAEGGVPLGKLEVRVGGQQVAQLEVFPQATDGRAGIAALALSQGQQVGRGDALGAVGVALDERLKLGGRLVGVAVVERQARQLQARGGGDARVPPEQHVEHLAGVPQLAIARQAARGVEVYRSELRQVPAAGERQVRPRAERVGGEERVAAGHFGRQPGRGHEERGGGARLRDGRAPDYCQCQPAHSPHAASSPVADPMRPRKRHRPARASIGPYWWCAAASLRQPHAAQPCLPGEPRPGFRSVRPSGSLARPREPPQGNAGLLRLHLVRDQSEAGNGIIPIVNHTSLSVSYDGRFAMRVARTRLGSGGRIVIPAEYRNALGLHEVDVVTMRLEGNEIRLYSFKEGVRRAQALVREFVPEGVSLADELIAERRREAELSSAILDASALLAFVNNEPG